MEKSETDAKNMLRRSQELRRNMTKEERHLWYDFLKSIGIKVHRQYVIGPYIADFYIASKAVVIELDGGGHYEEEQKKYDEKRNEYMRENGIMVLRYPNTDIHTNFEGVCEDILRKIGLYKG